MTPKRIQRKRTAGWRMPAGAKSVTRPHQWGNHWRIGDSDPDDGHPMTGPEVIRRFTEDATRMHAVNPAWLAPLRGKDLACFCPLCDEHKDGKPLGVECADCSPCHVDPLLRLSNQ